MRSNQHRRVPIEVRFWAKVDRSGPIPRHRPALGRCWVWTGKKSRYGYGLLSVDHHTARAAHRFSFELATGRPVKPGLDCCHACDNRGCVRPSHLFEATRRENLLDGVAKGLFTCGERNGCAKLTAREVRAIFARYKAGNVRQQDIGAQYGVTGGMVGCIVRGKSWRHLNLSSSS